MAASVLRMLVSCSSVLQPLKIPRFLPAKFSPVLSSLMKKMSTDLKLNEEVKHEASENSIKQEASENSDKTDVKVIPDDLKEDMKVVSPVEQDPVKQESNDPAKVTLLDEAKEFMKRVKRRKVVIMMSYCGQNYYGMQRNPETKTIEEELFNSFLKNNYFDEETFKRPQIANFQRAARTDKHVSAARQIVSVKIAETIDVGQLNQYLPPEIRVMGLKRVTQGFDAKKNCDARTYMYMTPTFAFAPIDIPVTESYRITPERIQELQQTLNLYLGPKNFHNFTSRKRAHDPSAIRNIYSFTCSEPFEKDGLEYVILRVKGQSFMMHQIRKMIGLVMAYMRGYANLETFNKCWTADRIDVPKAPGVGLMLDHVHYSRYDKKFGADGMHNPLTWESVEEKVQEFCDKFIYPIITQSENVEKSMMSWLSTLAYHTYDVRDDVYYVDEDNEEKKKADVSGIGRAFRAVIHKTGVEPQFCTKKIPGREQDDSDDEGEDSEDEVRPKKSKIAAGV